MFPGNQFGHERIIVLSGRKCQVPLNGCYFESSHKAAVVVTLILHKGCGIAANVMLAMSFLGKSPASDRQFLCLNKSPSRSASQEGQRFSYMGGRGGPLWQRIIFQLASPSPATKQDPNSLGSETTSDAEHPSSERFPECSNGSEGGLQPGVVSITECDGRERSFPSHFLEFLEGELQERRAGGCELPFDFTGGYIGYLGYELKAECGSPGRHTSPHPDAAMFFSDRYPSSLTGVTSTHKSLHPGPITQTRIAIILSEFTTC
jgi:hypothetical protein